MVLLSASRSARLLETRLHRRVARLAGNSHYTAGEVICQMRAVRPGRSRPKCAAKTQTRNPLAPGHRRLVANWSCAAPRARVAESAHAGRREIDWGRLQGCPGAVPHRHSSDPAPRLSSDSHRSGLRRPWCRPARRAPICEPRHTERWAAGAPRASEMELAVARLLFSRAASRLGD